jgi:hypothetical protein
MRLSLGIARAHRGVYPAGEYKEILEQLLRGERDKNE